MKSSFSRGLKLTYPVLLGYLSVGFIFGVLVGDIHQNTVYAFVTSFFLYAGAAQFLLIDLAKNTTPLPQVFLAVFLLNIRHIFYFAPVEQKLPQRGLLRWYCVLALTDETFAVLTAKDVDKNTGLAITILNHTYWIVGCTAGAFIGSLLTTKIEGIEFVLTALFIVLFLEKFNWLFDRRLGLAIFGIATAVRLLFPPDYFVLMAIVFALPAIHFLRSPRNV